MSPLTNQEIKESIDILEDKESKNEQDIAVLKEIVKETKKQYSELKKSMTQMSKMHSGLRKIVFGMNIELSMGINGISEKLEEMKKTKNENIKFKQALIIAGFTAFFSLFVFISGNYVLEKYIKNNSTAAKKIKITQ